MNQLETFLIDTYTNSSADSHRNQILHHDINKELIKEHNVHFLYELFFNLERYNIVMYGSLGEHIKKLIEKNYLTVKGTFHLFNGGIHNQDKDLIPLYLNGDPVKKDFVFVDSCMTNLSVSDRINHYLVIKYGSKVIKSHVLFDMLSVKFTSVNSLIHVNSSKMLLEALEDDAYFYKKNHLNV